MSSNRGIFDSFPSQSGGRQDSPFAIVQEPAVDTPAVPVSPFAPVVRQESPFSVVDEAAEARSAEMSRPVKLPERRKVDSPFQVAEPTEGFGFEAPAVPASPFEIAAAPPAPAPAPFSTPAQTVPASPFAVETPRPATAPQAVQAAVSAFTQWQEPTVAPASQPFAPAAAVPAVEPAAPVPPVQIPAAFSAPTPPPPPAAPVPAPVSAPVFASEETISDSSNIRQLELRAIFGVDREMNAEEILQRSRALPGMRNIARVSATDMATIEALKALVPNLGFGGGNVKLFVGSVPVEFIREGPVMLAVQTDGGFAPGVRETLMIVARELNRMG
jgi:hypothetical protein